MSAVPIPHHDEELDSRDKAVLIKRLESYRERWMSGEGDRRATDRKGAKYYRSDMWADGIGANRMPITANLGLSLYEKYASLITHAEPEPIVEAINDEDAEAADIITGALKTNWRNTKMQELMKVGQRLCGFTRAIGWYTYWRQELNDGIGDFDTRLIPAHRLITDDRHFRVRDMEFVGVIEEASRAKLMMLFPDKADELEDAGYASNGLNSRTPDPLRLGNSGVGGRVLDRLVATSSMGPYSGVASVRTNRGKDRDPLTDMLEVVYLWIDDPSPTREERPKLNAHGHPTWEIERDEDGEMRFDHKGHEVVETPIGPIYQPIIEPKMKMVMESAVVRKYKQRRHVAWVPGDDIILWDVDWRGPVPISVQRDTLPIYGFQQPGKALRLVSLGVARNVLYSIIFERLKLSLGGTWMATPASGLRKNKLVPEAGVVFQVNSLEAVKQFPVSPLDSAYFSLLGEIESEMMKLLGLSNVQLGQSAGRADSPATYDTLLEAGGTVVVDTGQLLEDTIADWCAIGMWFIQNYYTHEHMVEVEYPDGMTGYAAASALAARGKFAVKVESGSTRVNSRSAEFDEAKQAAGLGFYALPMLGKMGRVKHWRAGLKQRAAIQADPSKQWLLGASGAPPSQPQMLIRSQGRRSHHAPGGK